MQSRGTALVAPRIVAVMAGQAREGGYVVRVTGATGRPTMIDTAFFSEARVRAIELCRTPSRRSMA